MRRAVLFAMLISTAKRPCRQVHDRLHVWKTEAPRLQSKRGQLRVAQDAVVIVGRDLARETQLLCFDEFQARN